MSPSRKVLENVKRLKFGPESDIFVQAVQIALNYGEDKGLPYHDILCWSGRAFKVCWSRRMFYWDRFLKSPDPDPEGALRRDYASARLTVERTGHVCDLVLNTDCRRPESSVSQVQSVEADGIRERVMAGINEGRPVPVQLSLSPEHWAPDWCLITGYDASGDIVIGWSCFQDEKEHTEGIDFEPDGTFRKANWEPDLLAVVRIGSGGEDIDRKESGKHTLTEGVSLSPGFTDEHLGWGFEAYEAWAQSVADPENETVDLEVLKGRMNYHKHFVGHLASQKWYTSASLKSAETKVWSVSDTLHASANYAKIHELMWECWKVAGGYWRDTDTEVPKFQSQAVRDQIVAIIREAKALDEAAVVCLQAGLGSWDRSHGDYTRT